MSTATLHALFALLLFATALLPRRWAAAAAAGLAAYALGAGAFAAVPGIVAIGPLAARLAAVGLSPVFVGVNVGLMLLGAGGVAAAGLLALAGEAGWPGRLSGGVASLAGGVGLAALIPLLRVAGLSAAAAAGTILVTSAVLVMAGRGIAAVLQRATRAHGGSVRPPAGPHAPPDRFVRTAAVVAGGAAFAALGAPHVLAIVGAALAAAVGAHAAARRLGRVPRVPVLPILALGALIPSVWMLATVAGPVGLTTAALPMVPLSPPAQALLVPGVVAGSWAFLGAWPLHRWVPGPILAALAGALLLRIGAPALGAGFEHLQPALFAAGAAAGWHAALTRRAAAFLAALAFVATAAIFTGAQVSPDARVAAAVLYAAATAAAALRAALAVYHAAPRLGVVQFAATRLLALPAGAAIYAAIAAGLRGEVVLTVVVAAAAAAAAWRLRSDAPTPR